MTHESQPIERVKGQPVGVVKNVHSGPVRTEAGDDSCLGPGCGAVGAGDYLELSIINTGTVARLVGHEGHNEGTAHVDDLRGAGLGVVSGGVDAATGAPGDAIIRGENVVD